MKRIILTTLIMVMVGVEVLAQPKPSCKGITLKSIPCKSTFVDSTGYCKAHNPNAIRCGQPTKGGTPCKMKVKKSGDRCQHHKAI